MNTIRKSAKIRPKNAYALITVLLMVALLSIMVVSMFALVQDDRIRARGYMEVGRSRFLTDMATQEILAKIMDGSKVPWEHGKAIASYTAAPGVIEMRKYKEPINKGYHKTDASWSDANAWARNPFAHEYEHKKSGDWKPANPLTIPLYSRRWYAPGIRYMTSHKGNVSDGNPDYNPARVFNLNTPRNPYAPGSLYISGSPDEAVLVKDFEAGLGDWRKKNELLKRREINDYRFQPGEAAVDRPLNVQWIPIYKYAGRGNIYLDERGRRRRNPVVGRYAYWVDVENTKVNINVADRKFVDSKLATILGETEALSDNANGNSFYFIQNPNVRDPSTSDAVKIRGKIENSMMDSSQGPEDINALTSTLLSSDNPGRGDNTAAVTYYNLWMDWQDDGTPPYLADTSLVDWRAFTGLRPLAGGLGEETTIEGLLADAAADTKNGFNTFSEVFSLLDPMTEAADRKRGLTALTAMRRTYGNAATIYGWDEERDPLGLPKIDLVKLQLGGVYSSVFNKLFDRLKDPDYYLAYHTGTDPGSGKSFASGFNALVGDNNPDNDANGEAAVRQMLVNIIEYGKKHTDKPHIDERNGIVGAKSMPYVNEIATRVRNGFWRLQEPAKTADGDDEDPRFDTMATDFAVKVSQLEEARKIGDPVEIDEKVREIIQYSDNEGTFTARRGSKSVKEILTGVTVDLNAGMTNPNPFAEESTSRRNSYFRGRLKLNYEWSGIDPIEMPETNEVDFEGLYVARSIPVTAFTPPTDSSYDKFKLASPKGIRVDGESVYFDLGMIPGAVMHDPTKVTALRISGWEIFREGSRLFHKVPIRHLGQTSEPRPWWAMAQPDANPGMMFSLKKGQYLGGHNDSPDIFSLAQYYQPYNIEYYARRDTGVPWQWQIPNVPINVVKGKPNNVTSNFPYQNWKNVSVGWFTARTISEHCRTYGDDVVNQGLPGCLYLSEAGWNALTSEWTAARAAGPAQVANFIKPGGAFARAVGTLGHIANSIDLKAPALVERVVSLDPTVGHRTGNPNAHSRALGHFAPAGLPTKNVGHFYGTNGHTWRHGPSAPGRRLPGNPGGGGGGGGPSPQPQPQPQPPPPPRGQPERVPIIKPIYEEQEVTYRTPVGNTFIKTTKTIRVKVGEEIVGYRLVYPPSPKPPGGGGGGGGGGATEGHDPIRLGYHLTEDFDNPKLTSVTQREIYGAIFQHPPLQYGWEVEAAVGIGSSRPGRIWNPTAVEWNAFFTSAPKGDLMASIGEIGFCHSGLMGRPIELMKTSIPRKAIASSGNHWNAPYVGSPVYGLSPTILLDLLTPGAFRDNSTGERYSEAKWRNAIGSNTPNNPRRGTWNINALPASDTYMAMREGRSPAPWYWAVRYHSSVLKELKLHPVWAPNGHGLRRSWGTDRGWLDPMMNPFPRYRRGFESWLAVMVGDYTPHRSRGEAIWGRVESGGAYAVLSAPWYSWRVGQGGSSSPNDPTVRFDPDFNGAAASLMTMGRISIFASHNGESGAEYTFNKASGLFYSDQSYETSSKFRSATASLAETARVGNFALRHHNSEMITVSSQDISELHTALNPRHASVGWKDVTSGFLTQYGTYFQPYKGDDTWVNNGHPGNYTGTGIYANAPAVLAANQVSTAANVFTAHIVTQAIRDTGNEREDFSVPIENTNTGLGFMDQDDEVLGEQWSQIVIARIPGESYDSETRGPKFDYQILYSRTLDHQAQ